MQSHSGASMFIWSSWLQLVRALRWACSNYPWLLQTCVTFLIVIRFCSKLITLQIPAITVRQKNNELITIWNFWIMWSYRNAQVALCSDNLTHIHLCFDLNYAGQCRSMTDSLKPSGLLVWSYLLTHYLNITSHISLLPKETYANIERMLKFIRNTWR